MSTDTSLELAADSDFVHLLDLLALLPGPTEDRDFWMAVQKNVLPGVDQLGYVYEKMSHISSVIHEPTPDAIAYLAKYLLFFFSGDKPELWKILNRVTVVSFSLANDDTGRWWAQDVCRTAWALYVRYEHHGDDRWKDKWRLTSFNWHEWLPDRDAAAD